MEQTKNLTFDGHPVTLRKIKGNDVLVYCKKVTGLYSQIKEFKERASMTNKYTFGVKQSDICDAEYSQMSRGKITVACLTGTEDEMNTIMDECKRLLES